MNDVKQRVPREWAPCHADVARRQARGASSFSVEQQLQQLMGAHFGLIEDFQPVSCEPDDVPLAVYAARLANTAAYADCEVPRLASGAALSADSAAAACLGEAIERYGAGLPGPGSIVQATAGDLAGTVVTPDRFALFNARQHRTPRHRFPFARWSPQQRLGWVQGRSLDNNERRWVPAAFVFQPYQPSDGEPIVTPGLSTGLASGRTWTDAVVAGLCEVIERDAVSLAWLGQYQPPRAELPWDALRDETREVVDHLNRHGFHWSVFDLTTDLGVPTAAALLEGHSPVGHVVSFGSACHADADHAVCKALVEAAHCRMYVKSLVRRQPKWRVGRRYREVTCFPDHARFYTAHPACRAPLDRWWSTPARSNIFAHNQHITRSEDWLRGQTHRMAQTGQEVLVFDVTTPDVGELGWHVARTVVPGLQPLHGNHNWPHLGGRRLWELPRVFGPGARAVKRPNPYPHPCA